MNLRLIIFSQVWSLVTRSNADLNKRWDTLALLDAQPLRSIQPLSRDQPKRITRQHRALRRRQQQSNRPVQLDLPRLVDHEHPGGAVAVVHASTALERAVDHGALSARGKLFDVYEGTVERGLAVGNLGDFVLDGETAEFAAAHHACGGGRV